MERKIKLILLVTLLVGFWLVGKVPTTQASDASPTPTDGFNYQRAYQDYEYNLSLYDRAYAEYRDARTQYIKFQTITAKEEAQKKTLAMLLLRDEVVKTHLTAIRMKIRETDGISETDRNTHYTRIDNELKWFAEHKNGLSSAGSSLDDLVDESEKAKDRYEELTKIVIYSALNMVGIGKTTYLRESLGSTMTELKTKIAEIRQNQDKDTTVMERALPEIDNKLTRSKDKEVEAIGYLNSIKSAEKNKLTLFNKAQTSLEDAFLYLKEANTYLLEIVRQIKTNG